jgi:putative salt-induced outer membrane protein YdiY
MKKLVTTILLAAGILVAQAETVTTTNAAGVVKQEIKYPWDSSISAGLTLTSGNSDTLLTTAAIGTQRKTPVNEYTFGADMAYGKSDSVKNVETYHLLGQYNHLFSERAFGYLRTEFLRDTIADLRSRFTISPGAGYYFLKETNTTLAGEVGPGIIIRDQGGDHETFATLRIAERFEHKFAPGTRVWQSVELLPEVDKFQNYIINAELGAEAALSKSLSLRVVLSDCYNSEPAVGRKRNDVKIVSGIVYKF